MRHPSLALPLAVATLALATNASAEYVVFTDGRTMKVDAVRFEDGVTVVELRGGGAMRFGSQVVSHVAPDEDVETSQVAAATPEDLLPGVDWQAFSDPRFVEPIQRIAAHHDLDPALVAAVIKVESNFHPRAVSPKGAKGLMQLMPGTAAEYGVADPFDAEANIRGGATHLSGLLTRYKGDLTLALAAYNAGQRAVDRAKGIPAYRETRDYVARVLAFAGAAVVN